MTEIALRWALRQVKKKLEEKPEGGIKDGDLKIPYKRLESELESLISLGGSLKKVDFCKDCAAFGGSNGVSCVCIPYHLKNYTNVKKPTDFCSWYERRELHGKK